VTCLVGSWKYDKDLIVSLQQTIFVILLITPKQTTAVKVTGMRGLRRGLATLPPRNPGALSGQRAGWRPQEDLLNSTEISLCD